MKLIRYKRYKIQLIHTNKNALRCCTVMDYICAQLQLVFFCFFTIPSLYYLIIVAFSYCKSELQLLLIKITITYWQQSL